MASSFPIHYIPKRCTVGWQNVPENLTQSGPLKLPNDNPPTAPIFVGQSITEDVTYFVEHLKANTGNFVIQGDLDCPHTSKESVSQSVCQSWFGLWKVEFSKVKLAEGGTVNSRDKEFIAHTHNTHKCIESDSQSNAGSNNIRYFFAFLSCQCWYTQNLPTAEPAEKNTNDVTSFSYMLLCQWLNLLTVAAFNQSIPIQFIPQFQIFQDVFTVVVKQNDWVSGSPSPIIWRENRHCVVCILSLRCPHDPHTLSCCQLVRNTDYTQHMLPHTALSHWGRCTVPGRCFLNPECISYSLEELRAWMNKLFHLTVTHSEYFYIFYIIFHIWHSAVCWIIYVIVLTLEEVSALMLFHRLLWLAVAVPGWNKDDQLNMC